MSTAALYDIPVHKITGEGTSLADYRGKVLLIVNVASKCGFTPQYAELEKLYETYKDKLVIVGFPANNFASQEPGSNADIKAFCTGKYNVTFPMAAKISVKGDDIAPIYQWLTHKSENGVMDAEITWNFNKFLLDEKGQLIAKFDSKVTPMDPKITAYLQ